MGSGNLMANKRRFIAILVIAIIFSISFLNSQNVRAEPIIIVGEVTLSYLATTETTITLSWTEPTYLSAPNFGSYALEYSTSLNGPYTTFTTITNESQTTYAVTGLNNNTSYYFMIDVTFTAVGTVYSVNSNTLYTYTNSPPQLFYVSSTETTISLGWDDYNSYSSLIPFYDFILQMSTGNNRFSTVATWNDTNYTFTSSFAVWTDSYTVTGLTAGQTYQFKFIDEVGTSGQYQSSSEIESASTQATPTPTPEYPTTAFLAVLLALALVAVTVLTIRRRRIS
jgi:hypothetical protein